jgi:lysophospholipase L1-like esterase
MPARPLAVSLLAVLALATGCSSGGEGGASSSSPSSPSSAGSSSAGSSSAGSSSAGSPSAAAAVSRYVALGDSYTAAPGIPGQTSSDGCQRSSANYPHLVATALTVGTLDDVSCTSADTGDVTTAQLTGVGPQLAAVTADTDLVTIGLGGNDLGLFGSLITGCLRQDAASVPGTPCTDTLASKATPALTRIEANLVGVVRAVRSKAPSAQIMLVGYPQIIPASGSCANGPFAPGDYAFMRKVNHGLTQAVAAAARASKATYVDVWSASAGHDLCSSDAWINGLGGAGAAPFHPFAVEQQAVARLVAAAVA